MDDRDLYLALTKDAGAKEALRTMAKRFISPEALTGAALLGTAAYLLGRPGKKGEPSVEQRFATSEQKALGTEKSNEGFGKGMVRVHADTSKKLADLFAKHPVKGALVAAPLGAEAGIRLSNLIKWLI